MKTIYVEPASIEINGSSIGTVTKLNVNGNCELFANQANVWVSMLSDGMSVASKSLTVTAGLSESGANWADVEADVLSQLGLVKAANQNPEPVAPIAPAP
jgi:hypothetical protein